jgi:hypothetical protein
MKIVTPTKSNVSKKPHALPKNALRLIHVPSLIHVPKPIHVKTHAPSHDTWMDGVGSEC